VDLKPEIVKRYFESKVPGIRWNGYQGTARCRFHPDSRPSLSLNAQKGLFYCHACGAKGNLEAFERRVSSCNAKTARLRIEKLAKRGGGSKPSRGVVTVYSYKDENGKLIYEQVRFHPKDFRCRRPDKNGRYIWNLHGVKKILYHLREVLKSQTVFIVEGEKDVETLRGWGLTATCNLGGAGKWSEEYSKVLAGKNVIVLQDSDEVGQKHALAVTQSVVNYATTVTLVPCFPAAKDVTEWAERGGTKKNLLQLVAQTPPHGVDGSAPANSQREKSAPPHDWRSKPLSGRWVIRLAESLFEDYLVLPDGVPFVAALWVVGTHIFRTFDCYPYLIVTSPIKRCGKTRFAEVLELLCCNPMMSVNLSEAALFRSIESNHPPTVIIDEAEALRNRQSERAQYLLAILQTGFRQGAYVFRCVGKENAVTKFPVYSPKVVLAIGNLPDTLMDRSVVIRMRRHLHSEHVSQFRRRKAAEQASGVVSAISAWGEQNKERIAHAYLKQELDFLRDREADIWEPLFTIASVAVPDRLDELKRIATRLCGEKASLDVDDSQGLRLLSDIRLIFRTLKRRTIATVDLIHKLKAQLDSQWGEDLTPIRLSQMLRPFGISPRQLWIEGNNRGYDSEDFRTVFERYLPPQKALEALDTAKTEVNR
jgi:5S rRNA maturation endonuclease (ribonuclease M5)